MNKTTLSIAALVIGLGSYASGQNDPKLNNTTTKTSRIEHVQTSKMDYMNTSKIEHVKTSPIEYVKTSPVKYIQTSPINYIGASKSCCNNKY